MKALSKSFSTWHPKPLLIGISLFLVLSFTLVACDSGNSGSKQGGGGTPTVGTGGVTPTVSPGVQLGVQPCPDAVKAPSHWDPIIPTQAGSSKVESVSCGNLIGNPSLQALVTVRNNGSGGILDVYVYNDIISTSPSQIFKLLSLAEGDAKISVYNTVLTAEVDAASSINNGKPDAELVQDLFREFKWSDGAGTLVPIAFPGIYPDLTRFQAEADQAQVNIGHDAWKLDATMVANHLAAALLNWDPNAPTTLVSGGGSHDASAVVSVKSGHPGGGAIKITFNRLEGNTNGGIWEAISVESDGMSIDSPQKLDRLTSPITVTGSGNAFEGVVGKVTVLDHLYTDIGHATANGATGNGHTTFSTNVAYTSTFKSGSQEGIVVLYALSNADGSIAGVVMMKELL